MCGTAGGGARDGRTPVVYVRPVASRYRERKKNMISANMVMYPYSNMKYLVLRLDTACSFIEYRVRLTLSARLTRGVVMSIGLMRGPA